MITKTTTERLSVIEEQLQQNSREHTEIKSVLNTMNNKLDTAIVSKADQVDLNSLSNKMWGLVSIIFAAFIGLIVWLIQRT